VSDSLEHWLARQQAAHPHSIDLGLERVGAVARRLGLDRPAATVITVAGTNGKGSTAAHTEALLLAAGASVGLFTSPHFIRYNERIRIQGHEVTDAALVSAFEHIEAARGRETLTFFEYNTLAALWLFAAAGVRFAVLEVGLGGRLDATNLIDADAAVLCSVGLDHREWLGETLEAIGAEKAGIFRAGRPAVLGTVNLPESVYAAIRRLGARAVLAERDFRWEVRADGRWRYEGIGLRLEDLPPSRLEGLIQYRNAASALAAIESLAAGRAGTEAGSLLAALDARTVSRALGSVRLSGRFQVVPGEVPWILDIAHNAPAAQVFAAELARRPCRGRTFAVFGVLGDKDAPEIGAALAPQVDEWLLCALPGPRGTSAAALRERLSAVAPRAQLFESVEAACAAARATARPGDRVVVCGSVYTVGPALQWLGVYCAP
jgi:dihydrofolate synthase/folylpolyglutamate synthase